MPPSQITVVIAFLLLCSSAAHASSPALRGQRSAKLTSSIVTESKVVHRVLKKGKNGSKPKKSLPDQSTVAAPDADSTPGTEMGKDKSEKQKEVNAKNKSDIPTEPDAVVPATKTKILTSNVLPDASSDGAAATTTAKEMNILKAEVKKSTKESQTKTEAKKTKAKKGKR